MAAALMVEVTFIMAVTLIRSSLPDLAMPGLRKGHNGGFNVSHGKQPVEAL